MLLYYHQSSRISYIFNLFCHVFHVSQFSSSAAPEHGCSNCGPCIYALLSKPDGQHYRTVSRNTFKQNLSSSCSLFRMSPNSPSSYSLVGNLSGMLLNTDMVLDYPRPQPPTFLNIGGIQVTLISLSWVQSPSSGEGEPRPTTWQYKNLYGRWNIKSIRK